MTKQLNTTYILVANGSEAKLYSAPDKDLFPTNLNHISLTLMEEFNHPQSREKTSQLVTDGLGRYSGMGGPNSNFSDPTDPQEHEKDQFSRELAMMLDEKRKKELLHALILICPARFYGDLNRHLSSQVSKVIKQVIDKDYTKEPTSKLVDHLKNALALK